MRTRKIALAAATLLLAIPIAGCGGDKKSNRAKAYSAPAAASTSGADAAEAKGAARAAVSAVEACYADSQDYSQCKTPAVLKAAQVEEGSGPGEASVTAATASTYKIDAHAKGGAVFTIEKGASGAVERTCSGAGCEGGKW